MNVQDFVQLKDSVGLPWAVSFVLFTVLMALIWYVLKSTVPMKIYDEVIERAENEAKEIQCTIDKLIESSNNTAGSLERLLIIVQERLPGGGAR